jgi:hypothetical protein
VEEEPEKPTVKNIYSQQMYIIVETEYELSIGDSLQRIYLRTHDLYLEIYFYINFKPVGRNIYDNL